MEIIKVKASAMVKPTTTKGLSTTSLWLSNLDATSPNIHHSRVSYFFRAAAAGNFFDAAALKVALSRTLDEFPPVAGRLRKNDEGRVEINCNGEGVLFVEAAANGEMDELGPHFAPMQNISLTPKIDFSRGITAIPLLLVQVTRFKCGGVCLGVAFEHHAADGMSFARFINAWSEISRGIDITVPPFLDRRVLSARNPLEPKFTHVEYHQPPVLKNPRHNPDPSETIFLIFKLTRDQLNTLKCKCREDEGKTTIYSTFEVLAGHVWQCVSKARRLPEDQETKLNILVNGRSKLRPPLPRGYFGNAIFTATPIALCGDIESNPLKFTVRKIHEALARMDDEYFRSVLDYLELQTDPNNYMRADPFKSPNLVISSWASLPLFDADFGWGRPVFVGPGEALAEGRVAVLRSPVDDGSLLCAISLPKKEMQLFVELFSQGLVTETFGQLSQKFQTAKQLLSNL